MDIEQSLHNFQAAKPEQQDEINNILAKTTRELNKVRRIYEVPNPLELVNLENIVAPKQIIPKDGQFYILSQDKLYVYDNKTVNELADFSGGTMLSDWPNKNQLLLGQADSYAIYLIS